MLWYSVIAIAQFLPMAFLVICCVSAPVFKQIGLSKHNDYTYGVFGYCDLIENTCTSISTSYDPYAVESGGGIWKLSQGIRKVLGNILIITPVAAGLNFIAFLITLTLLISAIFDIRAIKSSGALFVVHLAASMVAFLSAALMCIVIFLLFFPHVTWCSWLLIPAAALSLIAIPLVFLAHSYISYDGYNNDDAQSDDQELIRITDVDDYSKNLHHEDIGPNAINRNANIGTDGHLVLPDFQQTNKPMISESTLATTSDSSLILKEKQGLNINAMGDEEKPTKNNKQTAFSAIDKQRLGLRTSIKSTNNNQTGTNQNLPYSLSTRSSSYTTHEGQNNMAQGQADHDNYMNDNDSESGLTSVSQRGVNPQYYQQHQPVMNHVDCYPANNNMGFSQRRSSQPSNYAFQPPNRKVYNNNMQRPMQRSLPQQQYPQQYPQQYQQPYLQQYQQPYPQQYQQAPAPPPPNVHNGSSNRYQPAYKKKIGRNNLPAASSFNDSYGFR